MVVPRLLSRSLSTTSDGRHLSIRDQSAMQQAMLVAGNVSPAAVGTSKSTVHRHRQINRTQTAAEILQSFLSNLPPFVVIHFDSKLIKYLTGEKSDRLVVLVSGKPHIEKPKLLAIPVISRSTGAEQCTAIIDVLSQWQCLNLTIAMVFDTTSSNTGKFAGVCISIEKNVKRALLWFACRHHVYEVHVKHVADHINGARNSPSDSLCVRFQKDWPTIDQSLEV